MKRWMGIASLSMIILLTYQSIGNDSAEWLGLFASFCGLVLSYFIID